VHDAAIAHAWIVVGCSPNWPRQGAFHVLIVKAGPKISIGLKSIGTGRPVVVSIKPPRILKPQRIGFDIEISIEAAFKPNRIALHIPPD